MSLLDSFFDTPITDSSSKINYTPINTGKILSSSCKVGFNIGKTIVGATYNTMKNIYEYNTDWCRLFEKTDIYNRCADLFLSQLDKCIGCNIGDVLCDIQLPRWMDNYWTNESNCKKYSHRQLRRIEKEFNNNRESIDICIDMVIYIWLKIIPNKNEEDELTESDVFKIKNKLRR